MGSGADSKMPLVAYLGPRGSYSHQATARAFPEDKNTLSPHPTIESVFAAVQQKQEVSAGVVPFENSSNGPVAFTLDLFADTKAQYRGIRVVGEVYLPVRHCLVGYHPPHPGSSSTGNDTNHNAQSSSSELKQENLSHITTLHSHPQAWGQCKSFLSNTFPHLSKSGGGQIDASSTSRAAEIAAADETGATAAISSEMAAGLYGLSVLARGIEDDTLGNCTRFLVIRRVVGDDVEGDGNETSDMNNVQGEDGQDGQDSNFKTLILFTLPPTQNNVPGALADCLAVFKAHDLTLTSINTRPSGQGQWRYVFFVEVVGRRRLRTPQRDGGGSGGPVDAALEALGKVAGEWRWVGSWRDGGLGR